MREVISVHVGQAGVQIGNACCKPFALTNDQHNAVPAGGHARATRFFGRFQFESVIYASVLIVRHF